MTNLHRCRPLAAVLAAASLLSAAMPAARGEILAFRGRVLTTVEQRLAGVPVSFDPDEREYDFRPDPQTLVAVAELSSTSLDGVLLDRGRGVCSLADPTVAESGNPGEYSLEAGCFSNSSMAAYTVTGVATETRQVRFDANTPGLEGVLPPAPGQQVLGQVWVSGTLVFWSTQPGGSLADTRATIQVTVRDEGRIFFDPTVLRLRLVFEGDADGRVAGRIEADEPGRSGPVSFEVLDLPALRALAESVDGDGEGSAAAAASAEAVEAAADLVRQADALGLDTMTVVIVPSQTLEYTHDLRLNFTYDLVAEFRLTSRNAPAGAGVAAVMGRRFETLAELIEQSATGVDGGAVQRAVNALARVRSADAGAGDSTGGGDAPSAAGAPTALCGALGPSTLVALGLILLSFRQRTVTARRDDATLSLLAGRPMVTHRA